jgi:hypothetical protein
MDAAAVSFFGGLLSDAEAPGGVFDQRLLISVFKGLWNPMLEGGSVFAGGCCSVPFVPESISLLSLDALESVLCEGGFLIDYADSLFEAIICLGCDYFPLLRDVRWNELSRGPLSVIGKISLPVTSESVWSEFSQVLLGFLRPLPSGFASLIVAGFPMLFAEFEGKRFTLSQAVRRPRADSDTDQGQRG